MRIWLNHRSENKAGSSTALLGALMDPASRWTDHVVGYRALREVHLAPAERTHAVHLLSQALERPRWGHVLLSRLGAAVFLAILLSTLTARMVTPVIPDESRTCMSLGPEFDVVCYGLGEISLTTPLLCFGLAVLDFRRIRFVRHAAATTLAQIRVPEGEEADDCSPPATRTDLVERSLHACLTRRKSHPDTISSASLLRALASPRSSDANERIEAYQALSEMALTPLERTEANHLLSRALKLPNVTDTFLPRLRRAAAAAFLLGSAMVAFPALIAALNLACTHQIAMPLRVLGIAVLEAGMVVTVLTIFLVPIFLLGLWWGESEQEADVQKAAAKALISIGDPHCIVALHNHVHTAARPEAHRALLAVLPTVTSDWYGCLPAGVSQRLAQMAGATEEEVALAALEALGRAGEGRWATEVKRIMQNRRVYGVREQRAAEILPILLARRERETSSASLLRSSQANATDYLLRPAHDMEPDVTNLLRASDLKRSAETSPP